MARYHIHHLTHYQYQYPVSLSHHATYLQPLNHEHQHCHSFSLHTDPSHQDYRQHQDYFGNQRGLFSIQEEHTELRITSESTVEVTPSSPLLDHQLDITLAQSQPFLHSSQLPLDVIQYKHGSPCIPQEASANIQRYAQEFFPAEQSILQSCRHLMQDIKDNFTFDAEATDINTPIEEFFQLKRGVCQDFAHFSIAVLCAAGVPAKYVSGYILTHPAPGQPRLEGADASHAWVSAYLPHHGWIDFDPTNNLFCSDQHITLAYGRDFTDVSLVRGAITGGGEHELKVAVTVKPI